MAFTVKFYQFSKPNNSTKRPATDAASTDYTCTVFESCGSLNPAFKFNIGNANPLPYNYCYVPHTGYYYFVREWRWEPPFWIADCQEDVLASWRGYIGGMSAYVLRAAAAWDGAIVDNLYPYKSALTVERSQTASGTPWDTDPANGTFVVGIVGSGATQYLMFNKASLDLFFRYILSDAYALDALGTLALATHEELKAVLDPLQYVSTITWLPITVTGTAVTSVRVGYVDVPIAAYDIGTGVRTVDIDWSLRRHPNAASRGAYLNASAAAYSIHYPPFGVIQLDPAICANSSTIKTTVVLDLRTGQASLVVFNESARVISRISGQVGIPYQVGQVLAPGYGFAGVVADVGKIGASVMSYNPEGIVQNGLAAIGNAAAGRIPSANTIGGPGGVDKLRGNVALQYEWQIPVDDDLSHHGRPLCQVRTLSTLPGYQLCADVEVNIPATVGEREQIKSYMESGYYYE